MENFIFISDIVYFITLSFGIILLMWEVKDLKKSINNLIKQKGKEHGRNQEEIH